MGVFDAVDGWFREGFTVQRQKPTRAAKGAARDAVRSRSVPVPARGGVKFSGGAKSANIRAVIAKAPEVMVKITGSNSGTTGLKAHLDYISRNGQVELTDENGDEIQGREGVQALRDSYKAAHFPKNSGGKEFLHVVFSMPPGTPEHAMKKAVANFAAEEFNNRHFVMALHDDKKHTHVHLAVSTRDKYRADEPRLSPRKNDLFRWRQGFAEKLREQGVDAAASRRSTRFKTQKSENFAVRQIRKDNPKSAVFDADRAAAKVAARTMRAATNPQSAFVGPLRGPRTANVQTALAADLKTALASGMRPVNPAESALKASRADGVERWQKVRASLLAAGDVKTANAVAKLVKEGASPPQSSTQKLFDLATVQAQKGHEQD